MQPSANSRPSARPQIAPWPSLKPPPAPRVTTTTAASRRAQRWRAIVLMCARSLIAACLASCMTACAGPAPVQTKTVTEWLRPPVHLATQQPVPVLAGDTTEDIVRVWKATERELKTCNGRAAALAGWMAEHPEAAEAIEHQPQKRE